MEAYAFDRFVFAPESGCLTGPRGTVELRRKTARLLAAFLDHPQRLLLKEELFEQVWPSTAVVDNVLAQGVRELRLALGDDARQPRFLRTRSARGYEWLLPVERLAASGPAAHAWSGTDPSRHVHAGPAPVAAAALR